MVLKNLVIYSSSAGSGKTYVLAKEYVKLALTHVDYFKHISAVTFTNKAAMEMKERIIKFLFHCATDPKNDLAKTLCKELNLNWEQLQIRCNQTLKSILHHYGIFSVGTIDSFFQQIIRSFAREMGISSGFNLEFDHDAVISEVVDEVIQSVDDHKELLKWLINFSEDRMNQSKSWDIRQDLKGFGSRLFQEDFKQIQHTILSDQSTIELHRERLNFLHTNVNQFEKVLKGFAVEVFEILETNQLTTGDFLYGKSGVLGFFEKIKEGNYEIGKRVEEARYSPEKWYTKKSPKAGAIHSLAVSQLIPILQNAVNFIERNRTNYYTAKEILKYYYQYALLTDITQRLDTYKRENELMLISDAAWFLKNLIENNEAPFVYEKIGGFYHHYLLDEFQDTSSFQWLNFKPLIEDSLSQGYSNLIVGDVKQSIYRWRGGQWDLLSNQLIQEYSDQVNLKVLDTNYRSVPAIVDFNNQLFKFALPKLEGLLADEFADGFYEKDMVESIYKNYHQHVSGANKNKNGRIEISIFDSQNTEDWKAQSLSLIPRYLEAIQAHGISASETGILVRTLEEGKNIANYLMEFKNSDKANPEVNYEIVSDEALFLDKSPLVQFIINLLTYINNPSDKVALYTCVSDHELYLKPLLEPVLFKENYEIDQKKIKLFKNKIDKLWNLNLDGLVGTVISVFNLYNIPGQEAYLARLQDVVADFISRHHSSLPLFIKWWKENSHKLRLNIPDSTNSAKIFTIHKSKGLQFKAVIIPFLDWSLNHSAQQENMIWLKSGKEPFEEFGYVPVRYSRKLLETVYADEYKREFSKAHIDNLNLLYVALTRPEAYLFMGLAKNESQKIKKVGDIVLEYIYQEHKDDLVWKHGYHSISIGEWTTEISEKSEITDKLQYQNTYTQIENLNIKPSFKEGIEEWPANDLRRRRGIIIHELLSKLKTKEDLSDVLDEFYRQGKISDNLLDEIQNGVNKLFDSDLINDWFSQDYEHMVETSILTGNNEIKIPDRVIEKDGIATVIEFKTGEKKEWHKKQVKEYIDLLVQMDYSAVKGYLVYLEEFEIITL